MKRTTLLRKLSKDPRKVMIRYLDSLRKKIVLKRDKACIFCGSINRLTDHHIFAKQQCPTVRFEPRNGVAVCWACHLNKCHTNPIKYKDQIAIHIDSIYGPRTYEKLKMQAMMSGKGTLKMGNLKMVEIILLQELNNAPDILR